MATQKIRRFTKTDWYGYAGAERFNDGSAPFIYETTLDDGQAEVVIIADKKGVEIDLVSEEDTSLGASTCGWSKMIPLSPLLAMGEMRNAVRFVESFTNAADMGFHLYNGYAESMKGFEYGGEF